MLNVALVSGPGAVTICQDSITIVGRMIEMVQDMA
jgi:hypothetical protein